MTNTEILEAKERDPSTMLDISTPVNKEFLQKRGRKYKGNSYESAYMEAVHKLFSSSARMSLSLEDEEVIIKIASKL